MKKLSIFAFSMLLALGFASCSKDAADDAAPNATRSGLSFTFDKPVGTYTTYADIASAAEWTIASLDIHVFKTDGTYVGKLAAADYDKVETDHTTTITMKEAWVEANYSNAFRFYFVANNAESTDGPHIGATWTGTEADFKALATNTLEDSDSDGYRDNLGTPILFSGVSSDITVDGGTISEEVTIKRRVARFDIQNQIPARFNIKSVLISDARKAGYIWSDAGVGRTYEEFDVVSMEPVSLPTAKTEGDFSVYESVFYTYPTKLDQTQIAILADLDGKGDKTFVINSTDLIEANKRYILVCKKGTKPDPTDPTDPGEPGITYDDVEFKVVAVDWDETIELGVVPGVETEQIAITNLSGDVDGQDYYCDEATMTFYNNINMCKVYGEVEVTSSFGTEVVSIEFVDGEGEDLSYDGVDIISVTKATTMTYGSFKTVDTYSFNQPITLESDATKPYNIKMTIASTSDAENKVEVYFVREEFNKYKNILCYDDEIGLNLDGKGKLLGFKWGSLIGVDMIDDAFSPDQIIFMPASFTDAVTVWEDIPYSDQFAHPTELPELNEQRGLGDPCLLATKNGAGLGDFKMPSMAYCDELTGTWDDARFGAHSSDGQFYPAAGFRSSYDGSMSSGLAAYWTSTPSDRDYVRHMRFEEGSYGTSIDIYDVNALPVRCIDVTAE